MSYADQLPQLTKQDIIDRITRMLGGPPLDVSTGSTEPKELLEAIVDSLSLPIDLSMSKPEVAEAIAKAGGIGWDDSCDSRSTESGGGSTITREGLSRLFFAVKKLQR